MTAPERLAKVAEVLTEHRLHASINICTGCKWRATVNAGSLRDQHEAHRAGMLAPLLDEFQAEDEARGAARVREAVEALADEIDGHPWRVECAEPGSCRECNTADAIRAALDAAEKETR